MSRTPARPSARSADTGRTTAHTTRGAATAAARPGAPVPVRAAALATEWAPVAGRILLALVLAWFGYHELVRPGLWTGYVPVISPTSSLAIAAVLAHGWVLLMLAVALAAGIATRLAALLAAAVMLEIIISLTVTAGLSDLTMRDVGVFGLAVCLTGITRQRFALRR
jgi:uncharacterized membrane protein YphA (DoxX/SURF4 family)